MSKIYNEFDNYCESLENNDYTKVKTLTLEKTTLQQFATKLFIILFIISMLLGYIIPVLRILNN